MSDLLEHGAIAFLYRPRVQTEVARGIDDVQAFYVVVAPSGGRLVRRLRVGRKRLPHRERRERFWAYVDRAGARPADVVSDLAASQYWTKTRGLRHQAGPRLAGEGVYALARHGAHVHLAYALRGAPPAEVRDELRIAAEASFIVATFADSVDAGVRGDEERRRFLPLQPEHLDVPGTELVLIPGGDAALAAVGGAAEPGLDALTAELRQRVRDASGRPGSAPLLEGIWH